MLNKSGVSFVSVCVTFLEKFYQSLKDDNSNFNNADIEKALVNSCKDAKGKENRFVSNTLDVQQLDVETRS